MGVFNLLNAIESRTMANDHAQDPQALNGLLANPKPDWHRWKNTKRLRLWQAVALSLNIDPDSLAVAGSPDTMLPMGINAPAEFLDRLETAKVALVSRQIKRLGDSHGKPKAYDVDLASFCAWAASFDMPLPLDFPKFAVEETAHLSGWPRGRYDTKLLRDLAAAANKFWKNYDPEDPSTAPTNQKVIDWLVGERKVAKRAAAIMATILRADGLPPGPRS